MPDLSFRITEASALAHAAALTVLFRTEIRNAVPREQMDSIMLRAQVRIEPARRRYDGAGEARLQELFGTPDRWGSTMRSLLWGHAGLAVPAFQGSAVIELPLACTYDFDVAASKYLDALAGGEIPLQFLFSGTVFYAREEGSLQVAQVPWDCETTFRMPVCVWKDAMEQHFPNTAWMRVRKDVFDRVYQDPVRHSLPTWEAALEHLLSAQE